MSSSLKVGDLSINRIIEQEGAFLPALDVLPGLTPELLAENRHWLAPKALDANDNLSAVFSPTWCARRTTRSWWIAASATKSSSARPQWNIKMMTAT